MALYVFKMFGVPALLIAAWVVFIIVEIKARRLWQLLSLVVVVMASCWFCSFYTRESLDNQYSDTYVRGCGAFVEAIDKLTLEGRTNEVHQACQNFVPYFFLSTDKQDISNFDRFVGDTFDLAFWQQPNTALEPTATAPPVSTNK